jgi:hypothetical protein
MRVTEATIAGFELYFLSNLCGHLLSYLETRVFIIPLANGVENKAARLEFFAKA